MLRCFWQPVVVSNSQFRGRLFEASTPCYPSFVRAILIWVADNGYARLLERYQYNPVAKRKIVLVANGHVAREVAALNFETIRFPRIFRDLNSEWNQETHRPSVLRCSLTPEDGSVIEPGRAIPTRPTLSNATEALPLLPARQRPKVANGSPTPRAPRQLPLPPVPGPSVRQPAQVLKQPLATVTPLSTDTVCLRMVVPGLDRAAQTFRNGSPKLALRSFPVDTVWLPFSKKAKQRVISGKGVPPDFDSLD